MIDISAVIITFNEAQHIERCIKSVQKVCKEVVVLDSFSTDGTQKLCRALGAKVYERKFDDYASQKNYANSLANCTYIFSIDADEYLGEHAEESFDMFTHDTEAVMFLRLNMYKGNVILATEWFPDWKVRLFRKDIAQWEGPIPHETLRLKEGTSIDKAECVFMHEAFATRTEHQQKIEFYAKMAAQQLQSKSSVSLFLQMLFSPLLRFVKNYFAKNGILLKKDGFELSFDIAKGSFLKYYYALKAKGK